MLDEYDFIKPVRSSMNRREGCVDLSDGVLDWVRLVKERSPAWEVIWTGHPWIMACVRDELVQFSEQADEPGPDAAAEAPLELVAAGVQDSLQERQQFAVRLRSRLDQRGFVDAQEISETIAGIAG